MFSPRWQITERDPKLKSIGLNPRGTSDILIKLDDYLNKRGADFEKKLSESLSYVKQGGSIGLRGIQTNREPYPPQ